MIRVRVAYRQSDLKSEKCHSCKTSNKPNLIPTGKQGLLHSAPGDRQQESWLGCCGIERNVDIRKWCSFSFFLCGYVPHSTGKRSCQSSQLSVSKFSVWNESCAVSEAKTQRLFVFAVMNDIITTMFNKKFMEELFKPQDLYSKKALRTVYDRLAHASIMRLNQASMDKVKNLLPSPSVLLFLGFWLG